MYDNMNCSDQAKDHSIAARDGSDDLILLKLPINE